MRCKTDPTRTGRWALALGLFITLNLLASSLAALPPPAASTTAVPPALVFQGRYYPTPFTVAFADIADPRDSSNQARTGWPSLLGAPSDRTGLLSPLGVDATQTAAFLGLDGLFGSRAYRQTLIADFNGDGIPDILANTYSSAADPEARLELYIGRGDGSYIRDTSNDALFAQLRGHGETMTAADFNNDGTVDIFLPYYTKPSPDPLRPNARHMSLLLNDGTGHFVDATALSEKSQDGTVREVDEAGVGCAFDPSSPYARTLDGQANGQPNRYLYWQPEGAQALDLNQDGRIDLYVGSRLFINQGNRPVMVDGKIWPVPVFLDRSADYGLTDLSQNNLAPGQLFHTNTGAFNQWANSHSYGSPDGPVTYLNAFGPMFFDEGAKFLDWNNDGYLDLVLEDAGWGPALFEVNPQTQKFVWRQWAYLPDRRVPFFNAGPPNYGPIVCAVNGALVSAAGNDGINAADLDNDGLEEVLTTGDTDVGPHVNWTFRNRGYGFEWAHGYQTAAQFGQAPVSLFGPVNLAGGVGGLAFADMDGGGLLDIVYSQLFGAIGYLNRTQTSNRSFTVEVVGPNGEKIQQGRVVTISTIRARTPTPGGASPVLTRVVESGSGYMCQSQYPLLIGIGRPPVGLGGGVYRVSVRFAAAPVAVTLNLTEVPADNRNAIRIYAPSPGHPSGRSEVYRLHAPAMPPPAPIDTVGVFRPSKYGLYLNSANAPQNADTLFDFMRPPGAPPIGSPANGVSALSGDWTGTGRSGIGLYVASQRTFYLRNTNTDGGADITTPFMPELDDVPLFGDWTGKGYDKAGVYRVRERTFYLRNTNTTGEADITFAPQLPDDSGTLRAPEQSDIPIVGDWTGTNIARAGFYRPRTQKFYLYLSNSSRSSFIVTWLTDPSPNPDGSYHQLAAAYDAHPIAGDWTNEGITRVGLYCRDSAVPYTPTFFLGEQSPGIDGLVARSVAAGYGEDGDVPIVGDWDNTGSAMPGLYRPGGSLFLLQTAGGLSTFRYGEVTNNDSSSLLGVPFIAPFPCGAKFRNVPVAGRWSVGTGGRVGVYQPHERALALRTENAPGFADLYFTYAPNAPSDDLPLAGDWLGQGITTVGAYRHSNRGFYLSRNTSSLNAEIQATITDLSGTALDGIPITGDWDGNGSQTIGLYDPAARVFYLKNDNSTGPYDVRVDVSGFAQDGDVPIAGNWSSPFGGPANGLWSLGLYRPADSHWLLFTEPITPRADALFVPSTVTEFRYGIVGDVPIVGHWK